MKSLALLSHGVHRLLKPFCGVFLIVMTVATPALADDPYNPPYDFNWEWTPDISAPAGRISPLCNDVVTVAPTGWVLGDDCPKTQWKKPDRIVSTYGPRKQFKNNVDNFDFHRGVDYRTVEMEQDNEPDASGNKPDHDDPISNPRPVFAVAAGEFVDVSFDSQDGYLVIVAHRELGVYTRYKHLSEIDPDILALSQNDAISAGQYLGDTGRSASGNHHLHFEVRKVTPDSDSNVSDEHIEATWKRNSIHPLRLVPYDPPQKATTVTVSLDTNNQPMVDLDTERWDVRRVYLTTCIWNPTLSTCNYPFYIPGSVPVDGYYINPPFTDFELSNYEYTHRGSSWWPTFQVGGADECPYVNDPDTGHGGSYDGDRHLDKDNATEHTFNGVTTEVFGSSTHYHRIFHFDQATMWASGCAVATVHFVNGDTVQEDVCW